MGELARNMMWQHYRRVVAYDLVQKLPLRSCHETPEVASVSLSVSRSRAMNDAKVRLQREPVLVRKIASSCPSACLPVRFPCDIGTSRFIFITCDCIAVLGDGPRGVDAPHREANRDAIHQDVPRREELSHLQRRPNRSCLLSSAQA